MPACRDEPHSGSNVMDGDGAVQVRMVTFSSTLRDRGRSDAARGPLTPPLSALYPEFYGKMAKTYATEFSFGSMPHEEAEVNMRLFDRAPALPPVEPSSTEIFAPA